MAIATVPDSDSTRYRQFAGLFAMLGAVLALAVIASACNSSADQARAGVYDPPSVEADFGDARLVFTNLGTQRWLWRFDHIDHMVEIYTPVGGEESFTIVGLSRGRDPAELFAYILDQSGVAEDQVMKLTEDGFIEVGVVEGLQCLSAGADETDIQVLQTLGETNAAVGVTGVLHGFGPGSPPTVTTEPFVHPHLFCPAFSDDHEQVAFGLPSDEEDLSTVGMRLQTGSAERSWLWEECSLIPWDFDSTGQRLAVVAECSDDARQSSGLYLFDLEDVDVEPTQIIEDRVGFTTWSPDDRWIAYVTLEEGANPALSTRISAIDVSTGDVVLVPFEGGSFPVWVSDGDQLPGNWS